MKTLGMIMVVLLMAMVAFAAVPTQVSYQGQLSNDGVPASGELAFAFRIYDQNVDGTLLWSDIDTLTVTNGLFNAFLGSNTPLQKEIFSGVPLWLEIDVEGETLSPRQQLATVPYSFRSAVADTALVALNSSGGESLWETNGTDVYRLNGNVGIGTTNPGSDLSWPLPILEISGSRGTLGLTTTATDGLATIRFKGPTELSEMHLNFDDSSGSLIFGAYKGGYKEALMINGNGNVGIGTTSPQSILHLAGSSPSLIIQQTAGSNGNGSIRWRGMGGINQAGIASNASVSDPGNLEFINGSVTNMILTAGGNVGIGTTSPASVLHVNAPSATAITTEGTIDFNVPGGQHMQFAVGGTAMMDLSKLSSGNANLTINGDLDVTGSISGSSFDDGDWEIGSGVLTTVDRLGIGTTNPDSRFHVQIDVDTGFDQGEGLHVVNHDTNHNTFAIYGETQSKTNGIPPGTSGAGSAVGVYGRATSHTSRGGASLGVLGINHAETTEGDVAAGVFGQAPGFNDPIESFSGKVVGVWGESWSTDPDGAGVVGKNNASSGSTRGVYGESKSPNGAGVWGENTRSSGYAVYAHGNLHIEDGNLTITNGVKNAVVPTSRGMTKLYCEESAEVWFTDYGFGTLTAGQCTVQLDPLFMETVTVNDRYTMMVSVEFYGPHGNHYVERDQDSFTVVDPSGSNSQFSWQVRAKRNGYETARLEDYDQSDTN